jgi:hypothetical protein
MRHSRKNVKQKKRKASSPHCGKLLFSSAHSVTALTNSMAHKIIKATAITKD